MNNVLGWFRQFEPLVILRAIRTAHRLKGEPLEVHTIGWKTYFYDERIDDGYQKYKRAIYTLREHPILYKLLKKAHAI